MAAGVGGADHQLLEAQAPRQQGLAGQRDRQVWRFAGEVLALDVDLRPAVLRGQAPCMDQRRRPAVGQRHQRQLMLGDEFRIAPDRLVGLGQAIEQWPVAFVVAEAADPGRLLLRRAAGGADELDAVGVLAGEQRIARQQHASHARHALPVARSRGW